MTTAKDLSPSAQADLLVQGMNGIGSIGNLGVLAGLGDFCATDKCLIEAIERPRTATKPPGYLERAREIDAKLARFPKVLASPLGQRFQALFSFLKDALRKASSGSTSRNPLSSESPYNLEKQLFANLQEMVALEAQILEEARKLGDSEQALSPEIQRALDTIAMPGEKQPSGVNWWLWGGIGAAVLGVGGFLWWKASKVGRSQVAGLGRMRGRNSRSRRHSR